MNEEMLVWEAADLLEMSQAAVRTLIALGDIPKVEGSFPILVRREDVVAYIRRDHPASVLWGSFDPGTRDEELTVAYWEAADRQRQAASDRRILREMEGQPDLAHIPPEGLPLTRREALMCLGIGSLSALFWLGIAALAYFGFKSGGWFR